MRNGSFFTFLYVRVAYTRLVYNWYKNILRIIAVLIVFLAVNGKKRNMMKKISKQDIDAT